jgi:hypothetical protein
VKSKKKGGSVLDRISDIDFAEDEGIAMLIYGPSKTGKTTLAATFPGKILWVIVSGGNKPGELRSINTAEYRKKVKRVELETAEELRELIAFQAETNTFKTMVVDHVTGLQDLVMSEILGKPIPAQKSWGDAKQQDYGKCALIVKDILRNMLGLSCNRIILGQERTFEGKEDNEIVTPTIGVALQPSIAGWLYPAVDYICQTFKKRKTETKTVRIGGKDMETTTNLKGFDYCLRTGPHEVYTTGFRLPKGQEVPEYLVDPDYKDIMALINGG